MDRSDLIPVVAVGLNKTGTRSLGKVMKRLGYRVWHSPRFSNIAHSQMQHGQRILDNTKLSKFQFFSDIFYASNRRDVDPVLVTQAFRTKVIRQLVGQVRCIINTRNVEEWLRSRRRHTEWKLTHNSEYMNIITVDEDKWRNEYEEHYTFLRQFFNCIRDDAEDHLELDICGGDNPQRLLRWLGVDCDLNEFPLILSNYAMDSK